MHIHKGILMDPKLQATKGVEFESMRIHKGILMDQNPPVLFWEFNRCKFTRGGFDGSKSLRFWGILGIWATNTVDF